MMVSPTQDLASFFRSHYQPVRLLGRAEATVADMQSFIHVWDATMGPVALADIDLATAANFLRHSLKTRSPATCNKYRSYLLTLLREARRLHLTQAKWFRQLRRLPEEKKLPTAWTREQVEAILRVAAVQPGEMAGIPLSQFYPALILTIVNTSLRISAALSLKTADVDLAGRWMIVRAGRQKQKAEQFFGISERTAAAIEAIYDPARLWLFPWVAAPITLRRHFERMCKTAGVPAGGHSGVWHRGRVTAVTHAWCVSPEYARQLAGHPSIDTTAKHYVDPRIARPAAAVACNLF